MFTKSIGVYKQKKKPSNIGAVHYGKRYTGLLLTENIPRSVGHLDNLGLLQIWLFFTYYFFFCCISRHCWGFQKIASVYFVLGTATQLCTHFFVATYMIMYFHICEAWLQTDSADSEQEGGKRSDMRDQSVHHCLSHNAWDLSSTPSPSVLKMTCGLPVREADGSGSKLEVSCTRTQGCLLSSRVKHRSIYVVAAASLNATISRLRFLISNICVYSHKEHVDLNVFSLSCVCQCSISANTYDFLSFNEAVLFSGFCQILTGCGCLSACICSLLVFNNVLHYSLYLFVYHITSTYYLKQQIWIYLILKLCIIILELLVWLC